MSEFIYERDMPDYIKNMTKEELDKYIKELEKEPFDKEKMNIFEQTKAYENYIKNHINNVIEAYNHFFIPILDLDVRNDIKFAILQCGKQIYKHDQSKWFPEEFDAYRKYFYPTDKEKANKNFKILIKSEFDKAWEHHHKNNGHHPEHWNKQNDCFINMPLVYIIEMMCDWYAMSKHFGTDCYEWWKNAEKERSFMTQNTIDMVEDLFHITAAYEKDF